MLDEPSREVVVRSARIAQVVTLAMCLGVSVFAGFVVMQRGVGGQGTLGVLTLASLGLAATAVPAGFLIGQQVIRSARSRLVPGTWRPVQEQSGCPGTEVEFLVATYQNQLIVGAALLEGACFLALMAYLTESHLASLAVAGMCLLGILARFPTAGGLADWVERQLQRIREERQFSA